MNRVYDLIFSLGGNCAAAHNLKIRRLRPYSLPFDWTYMVDERPIAWLISAIDSHMSGFCEKSNLEEILPGHPEYNGFHRGYRKYIDKATGYRFVNHFPLMSDDDAAYEEGIVKLRRRIDRLFESFERCDRILMVLGVGFPIRAELLIGLRSKLLSRYPGKVFDIDIVQFNADRDAEEQVAEGIVARRFTRDWNTYDTEGQNFEWRFMDDIKSTVKPKTRGKVSFHVWPHVKCVVQFHHT